MDKKTVQTIARGYFDRIVSGHINAVQRPDITIKGYERIDRTLRRLVEKANHEGDCIINVGRGYYRPIPGDPTDELEFKEYIRLEDSRADKLWGKVYSMKTAFENWKKEAEAGEQQRQGSEGRAGISKMSDWLRI